MSQLSFAEAVVDRINAMTARARDASVPVIFVQDERHSGGTAAAKVSKNLI